MARWMPGPVAAMMAMAIITVGTATMASTTRMVSRSAQTPK